MELHHFDRENRHVAVRRRWMPKTLSGRWAETVNSKVADSMPNVLFIPMASCEGRFIDALHSFCGMKSLAEKPPEPKFSVALLRILSYHISFVLLSIISTCNYAQFMRCLHKLCSYKQKNRNTKQQKTTTTGGRSALRGPRGFAVHDATAVRSNDGHSGHPSFLSHFW